MVQSEEVSRGGVHRASWPHLLLACAGVLACAAAMVNSGASAGRTELHESSDMREIDKMLSRIHKLTKHGYDGHREHSHKTKLVEKKPKESEQEAKLVEKKPKESEKRQPAKQAEERLAHKSAREVHTVQKAHEDTTAHEHKNKALHELEVAHKHKKPRVHEQKPKGDVNKHVNKALQEAMNAEKAAMHSDDKKARGKRIDTAKRKSIEKKMMHLQAQISKDFNSVTTFGKKAGYLPPIKMPHM